MTTTPTSPGDVTLGPAAELLDALAVAWTTFQLYPNPADQPIFDRSVSTIAQAVASVPMLVVRSGSFAVDGIDVPAKREGVDRLARRFFVHDVETLHFQGAPSAHELLELFRILGLEEHQILSAGGLKAAAGAAGVVALQFSQRRMLSEEPEEDFFRDADVAETIDQGGDPEEFAARMLEEAGRDPSRLAKVFGTSYRQVYAKVSDEDTSGREEVVRAYVEAFDYFPREHKIAVLENFIAEKDDGDVLVFLDQFPGHELAELSPDLDPHSFSLLIEYARVTKDDADARPEELLPLLQPEGQVRQARRMVAERVGERLKEFGAAAPEGAETIFSAVGRQLPRDVDQFEVGIHVIRGLFECEERPHRFRRVVRIWTGRTVAYIRAKEWTRARAWMAAVLEDPPYQPYYASQVEEAFQATATPDLLRLLVNATGGDDAPEVGDLLRWWGPVVVDELVEMLATEESSGTRRVLIDLLVEVARDDVRRFIPHLEDERWFVVRNLAIILGRSGHHRVGPQLRTLLKHPDHRVRVEAMRGLVLIADGAVEVLIGALSDSHERVRQNALNLLRTQQLAGSEATIVDAITGDGTGASERQGLVDVLARIGTPSARAALEELAGRKVVLRPAQRAIRDAARAALEEKETT
jgi:hypothetical protein